MAALKNHSKIWSDWLWYFDHYRPWGVHAQNGGTWDDYPEHSKNILNFKKGKTEPGKIEPAAAFQALIEPFLVDNIAIVVVPGHDPANPGTALPNLASALATKGGRVDASSVLVRKTKISKLARGGDRSEEVHAKTVSVEKAQLIKGKDVLLLDDVAKTGNSLRACQKILIAAGARSVTCATIGKT